jgi:hypothetical protein
MKITMQMTVADLIQTLRWKAMELAEDEPVRTEKDQTRVSQGTRMPAERIKP